MNGRGLECCGRRVEKGRYGEGKGAELRMPDLMVARGMMMVITMIFLHVQIMNERRDEHNVYIHSFIGTNMNMNINNESIWINLSM
jgi:hypothetical protein